jgi:hypothetical protein
LRDSVLDRVIVAGARDVTVEALASILHQHGVAPEKRLELLRFVRTGIAKGWGR